MEEKCGFAGNSDMYGLGIRAGFYLQWYGSILASWIAKSEVPSLRISNLMFVFATFLALILHTTKGTIRPVEIYITLLLTFGGYLYLVPVFLWRVLTGFKAQWDPTRFPQVRMGKLYSALNFILLLAVSGFQLWFWVMDAKRVEYVGCPRYGFFFWRIRLDLTSFVVGNLAFHIALLCLCLAFLGLALTKHIGCWGEQSNVKITQVSTQDTFQRMLTCVRPHRKFVLRVIRTICNICVASVVLIATELTIFWNGINGVAEISSVGQLIPFVIGIEMVLAVLYAAWFGETADSVPSSDSAESVTRFPDLAIQQIDYRRSGPSAPTSGPPSPPIWLTIRNAEVRERDQPLQYRSGLA
ncbi:hypothetical protein HYFRA_00013942 [Hymenoscyphus fraxineus]|uniref:Uncharacterized protein n=1 Tax=Hymenoscyphus fraxineus TaxID=746836 RepID=A0A9N9L6X5_9HELO|nr:hypothetical protein HYFRA_00013942 [Hymenoscyphus fraxineus]